MTTRRDFLKALAAPVLAGAVGAGLVMGQRDLTLNDVARAFDLDPAIFHQTFQSALLGYDAQGEIWGLAEVEKTLGVG